MPIFSYRAANPDGGIVDGVIEANDEKSAVERLKNSGVILLKIAAQGEKRKKRPVFRSTREDLLTFTTELSTLLGAGLPLDTSLDTLSQISESSQMKETIKSILDSIKGGNSFSEALKEHPKIFSPLYINMIRAGEAGGVLDIVLENLNEFLETTKELKEHIISSMIYPAILLTTGGLSIIILLLFMVPRFTGIFADLGTSMPLATRLLLAISSAVKKFWWVFFLFAAGTWFILRNYRKSDKGKYRWDSFKLRMAGEIIRKLETARFCRVLGTLLKSGVPMLQALNNAKDVINNQVMASAVSDVSRGAKEGKGITVPLSEAGVFPSLAVSMIKVGENTGQLDGMLIKVAISYEKSLKIAIRRFISFLEPAAILIMGLIIGFIVVSVLLGIFSISELPF